VNFRAAPSQGGADHGSPGDGAARPRRAHGQGALSVKPFRRLWIALSLSSLGDWLSIIALTALAPSLTSGGAAAKASAVSGVWLVTLLPALLFGPLAGALADRLDRRMTMITGDVLRGLLYLSIPLFPNLTWIYVVKFVAGVITMFWSPATSASIPNLVPKDKLEQANQLSLIGTYGSAPVAAGLFSVLALISEGISKVTPLFHTTNVDLALYFNAASYFISGLTVFFLRQIPQRSASDGDKISVPSTFRSIWEGWRFIGETPVVRGLVIGMVGGFIAAGVVIGLGYPYVVDTLHGGSVGWGVVFAAIFVGMGLGLVLGRRLLRGFSLRREFGLTIAVGGIPLALAGLIPSLVAVVLFVILIGGLSGIAYSTGFTIVGLEVDDETRGRVFAFFQSSIQVILFLVIAVVGFLSAGITKLIAGLTGSGSVKIGSVVYASVGQNIVFLLAAAVAILLGWSSYRQMDDRKGVSLREDLLSAIRGEALAPVPGQVHPNGSTPPQHLRGLLIAFEGGEGTGKSTQARLIAIWLRELGYDVVTTFEPGATKVGMRLRALLLDTAHAGMSPQSEALMYAADRAEHVASVIEPAIARGAIVITDRYVDSSLAYQGAGRNLPVQDIADLNRWATGGRVPDLTVLLDMDPLAGLSRRTRSADRLEAEPAEFHQRVRAGFLALARSDPQRYLMVDAGRPAQEITGDIEERIRAMLPDPVPAVAEANTGSFPAVTDETVAVRRPESNEGS
jgi:dTMP kinase